MKCYNCFFHGLKEDFKFDGTELIEGHILEKYICPKCEEIHWTESKESYDKYSKK